VREYIAFTKKEFKENLRNYKLFSLIILFKINMILLDRLKRLPKIRRVS